MCRLLWTMATSIAVLLGAHVASMVWAECDQYCKEIVGYATTGGSPSWWCIRYEKPTARSVGFQEEYLPWVVNGDATKERRKVAVSHKREYDCDTCEPGCDPNAFWMMVQEASVRDCTQWSQVDHRYVCVDPDNGTTTGSE